MTDQTTETVAAEAPANTESAATASPREEFDFDGVDFEGDLDGVVIGEAAPPVVPEPAKPEAAAAAPEPAPEPAPQPTPQAAQPQPQAQAPEDVITTPEGFLDSFARGKENMINLFAEQTFALTDDEREALATEPETVIPRLMGRTLFAAIESAQRLMMAQLPVMITNHTTQTTRRQEAETEFFKAFPDLRDAKYLPAIQAHANYYKTAFPDMPLAERIQAIGLWARTHFKLPAPAPAAAPGNPAPAQPTSQVVQSRVFQPAAAAGGVGGMLAQEDDSPFAGAFLDYD